MYVHNSMGNFFFGGGGGKYPENAFSLMQFSQNIDGFRQNNSQVL